ncbi:toxin-activating lysine-acyltransferase [Mesorhizobium sp. M00.F.Ca.ET.216.01.1.1]|uniref:toxin-activating lysine-acyltransferase n=1 Tax=Mesorhizobium sp. M00.F.Ca.ET.216.01.1.1 TaxID=2500528 RepID=UPI001FE022C6|nr:toxin-activating lysine-acyltransferase [Mesorhizobium sp. M00.F.Ca.ET.216.01.1.1]
MDERLGAKENERIGYFEALGMVTALALASELHRDWSISDVDHNIIPALRVGQCKIYRDDRGQPTACVTWAVVDKETHSELLLFGRTPPSGKWSSGPHLWFIDAITPFGHPIHLVRDLQRNHFAHLREAHAIRRNPDGSIKRIQTWRNRVL